MRSIALLLALLTASPALARGLGSEPSETATTPELLFFIRLGQLWRTDGTAAGTWEIDRARAVGPTRLTVMNGKLYFLGNDGLYTTDGSRAPAQRLGNFTGVELGGLGTNGTQLFFFSQTKLVTSCLRMWTSDGTVAGTRVFNSLLTDEASSLTAAGGKLLFRHYPMQPFEWRGRTKYDLWATDGTVAGTGPLLDSVPGDLRSLGGVVLFGERPLMRSDGTVAGTFPLAPHARVIGVSGEQAIFVDLSTNERAIGLTDGTLDGTQRIGALPFVPTRAAMAGDTIIAADHEVWALDRSGSSRKLHALANISHVHSTGDAVLLTDGASIWRTDGTDTSFVAKPGGGVKPPFHQVGDRVIFFASNGINGIEPWVTDGTPAGTRMIANLAAEGTIRGRVTDFATGAPLVDAFIEVTMPYTERFSVPAGHDGRYEIEGVTGAVYLVARAPGHLSQPWGGEPCSRCGSSSATAIHVESNGVVDNVNFALPVGGTIGGRVVDAQGKPMPNVTVQFAESLLAHPYLTAVTRDDGTYLTDRLIPGRQLVAFIDANGYSRSIYAGITCSSGCGIDAPYTRVSAPDGGTREGVDFMLHPWPRLRGRILDAVTGKPVTVPVTIEGWQGWTLDSTVDAISRSNPDGTYEIVLRDGRYFVRASQTRASPFGEPGTMYRPTWYPDVSCTDCLAPRGVEIVPKPGEIIEHDFRLQPHLPRIGGTVTDAESGAPLANVTVEIIMANGAVMATARTGEDGTYETPPSLMHMELTVRIKPFGSYHGAMVGPLVLTGNERRIVDLRLERIRSALTLVGS